MDYDLKINKVSIKAIFNDNSISFTVAISKVNIYFLVKEITALFRI